MSDDLPPFMNDESQSPPPIDGGGSFAESMGAFGKMLKIQEKISDQFPKSKVPWSETRKFLKAHDINSIKSTPLYKFHMNLFKKIGLGDMQLVSYAPMHYIFAVPNCPVCSLYPALENQKVCVATSDALHRFFTEDLELECTVEEIECVKDGDKLCKFKVDLQPISAYQIMLDSYDKRILHGERPSELDEADIQQRIDTLTVYKLIENGKLTDIGDAYLQYAGNVDVEEKEFEPPWKKEEELAEIASKKKTFGAAFGEMAQKVQKESDTQQSQSQSSGTQTQDNESDKSKEAKEESKDTQSFAELFEKMKKKQK
jgi:hypothetical protein